MKLLVDCDTGIDDAMALLYLLSTDGVEIVGISTVFGNVSASTAASASYRVLQVVDRTDIPVAVGADCTLTGDIPNLAPHVHGVSGLGSVQVSDWLGDERDDGGAEQIVNLARQFPGELHLLATGPLTNVALAVGIEPRLPYLIPKITIMGGACEVPGNQTASAEANILHDPESAAAVLKAPWDITLVPLDCTMEEILTESHRARLLEAGTELSKFVYEITDHYFDYFKEVSFDVRSSPCHDALAAAISIGDVVPVRRQQLQVTVDCSEGPSRGATICDTRERYRNYAMAHGSNCSVVMETDKTFADSLVERFILQ